MLAIATTIVIASLLADMKPYSRKLAELLLLAIFNQPAEAQFSSWNLTGTTVALRPELAGVVLED
jgi:hypothetical protein